MNIKELQSSIWRISNHPIFFTSKLLSTRDIRDIFRTCLNYPYDFEKAIKETQKVIRILSESESEILGLWIDFKTALEKKHKAYQESQAKDELCKGCGDAGKVSIILAEETYENDELPRLYIPNQAIREGYGPDSPFPDPTRAYFFCPGCIRTIEDNFRATVLYLQSENGLVSPKFSSK